jgi:hypothetical protein
MFCTGVALAIALAGCRASRGENEDRVEVTCGDSLGIAPADAARKDWNGEIRQWSAEARDDTLRLLRKGRCGDECTFVEEIVLSDLAASCPRFVRASITRRDAGSPVPGGAVKVVEARHGTLRFQEWVPMGGRVVGRLDAEFSLTFYATIAKEKK